MGFFIHENVSKLFNENVIKFNVFVDVKRYNMSRNRWNPFKGFPIEKLYLYNVLFKIQFRELIKNEFCFTF